MVLSILLVDNDPQRARIVEEALAGQGYRLLSCPNRADLRREVQRLRPDLIIINADSPDRDTLEQVGNLTREDPHPVVMFVDRSDQETNVKAVEAGVSAYVVDGLAANRVRPVLEVAIARFRQAKSLRDELTRSRAELADRKSIDRAKGLLMAQRGWNEQQAYEAIRKMAMDQAKPMGDVARSIIAVFSMLKP